LQNHTFDELRTLMTNLVKHPSTVPPITQNLTSAPDVHQDFRKLLDGVGLDPKDTGGEVTFTGADPILPSKHRLGAIMAMGMMGPAVATQILYRMRGGPAQDLSVDLRKAVAHINPLYMFKPTAGGYPLHSPLLSPAYGAMEFNICVSSSDLAPAIGTDFGPTRLVALRAYEIGEAGNFVGRLFQIGCRTSVVPR
jgi:hypothetical protein